MAVLQLVAQTREATASESASENETRVVHNKCFATTRQPLEMTGLAARSV
jgi:hypothetical protein